MDKNKFFMTDECKNIDIKGQVFKYKLVNTGNELDWVDDYMEDVSQTNDKGEKVIIKKQNLGKLSICKLRNIMELPFTKEELEQISGVKKDFKDYTNEEKDLLFRNLDPTIFNELVTKIDKINHHKKKD